MCAYLTSLSLYKFTTTSCLIKSNQRVISKKMSKLENPFQLSKIAAIKIMLAGHGRSRALQDVNAIVLPQCSGMHPRFLSL